MTLSKDGTIAIRLRQRGTGKKERLRALTKQLPWIAPVSTLALVVLVWDLFVRFSGIPKFILPAPSAVLASLVNDFGLLMRHAGVTTMETVIGFLISAVIGIIFAVVMVMWPVVGAGIFPIIVASQVIPKVAVAPLMVVWIGAGATSATLIAFVMAFFPVVVNATLGMKSVAPASIDLLGSMGASKWQVFRYLRFPNALPYTLTGLQLAVAFAIVGAIVGEFVGADAGLGYLLIVTQGNLRTDLLFAALVVLTIIGLVLYYGVELLGKLILRNRQL